MNSLFRISAIVCKGLDAAKGLLGIVPGCISMQLSKPGVDESAMPVVTPALSLPDKPLSAEELI